jgi:hypothetical protein
VLLVYGAGVDQFDRNAAMQLLRGAGMKIDICNLHYDEDAGSTMRIEDGSKSFDLSDVLFALEERNERCMGAAAKSAARGVAGTAPKLTREEFADLLSSRTPTGEAKFREVEKIIADSNAFYYEKFD